MTTLISKLASPAAILALSGATTLAFRGERARFAIAAPLAFGTGKVIKYLFPKRKPKLFGKHKLQSFPSGHSGGSTAFAMSLALSTKRPLMFAAAGLAMLAINGARIYEGEHDVRDCIAGDLLGIAAALTAHAIVTSPSTRSRAHQLRERVAESLRPSSHATRVHREA